MTHEYLRYMEQWDDESFRRFMQQFGQDVWNYAYLITKRKDLSDDIAQEVFIKSYFHIADFRGQSSIKTWLLTITRNTAVNTMRSAYLRKVTLQDWFISEKASRSAEQEVLDEWSSSQIWNIVLKLPRKYREVLILDAHYGLPVKEIALLLGIPQGTVKSRLFRARERTASLLKEEMHFETI